MTDNNDHKYFTRSKQNNKRIKYTNNDNQNNDDLDLKSIFQSCLSYELRIINRWGNLVYLQKNDSEPFNCK